ncbi:helix-turn-helix transcriptional regulator [Halobacteriaceae archaeon GCM10025711]
MGIREAVLRRVDSIHRGPADGAQTDGSIPWDPWNLLVGFGMVVVGVFFHLVSIFTVITQALVLTGFGWLLRETTLWMRLRSLGPGDGAAEPRTAQSTTPRANAGTGSRHADGGTGNRRANADAESSASAPANGTDRPQQPDDSLVTGEERIVALLRKHGGRMRQKDIVAATRFSKATVSRKLSRLEQDAHVVKLTDGRENVVCLPEAAPPGALDDERSE